MKFDHTPSRYQVQASFDKHYKEHTHVLHPTAVDYFTKVLSREESRLFNSGETFRPAVDFILQNAAPCDIIAGVHQYRHYRDSAHSLLSCIKVLQKCYEQALEHQLTYLEDLEGADTFNRLINLKDCASLEVSPNFDTI